MAKKKANEEVMDDGSCGDPGCGHDHSHDHDHHHHHHQGTVTNPLRDVGRNDPCPCGSGSKFKKCCLGKG